MEENKKGNNNIMLIIIIILLLIIIIGGAFGFIKYIELLNNKNDKPKEDTTNVFSSAINSETTINDNNISNTPSNVSTNTTNENAKKSTRENPLNINQWGLASKYVSGMLSKKYSNTSNVDVPVRITNVTRGNDAKKIVTDWINSISYYKYEEPKAYTEWIVFDYDVDLSNISFDDDTVGTAIKINSNVEGLESGSIIYNDIRYIVSTVDMSNTDYVKKPGVYHGKFASTIPVGCKDYLVKLGDSYSGAESYFRVEY